SSRGSSRARERNRERSRVPVERCSLILRQTYAAVRPARGGIKEITIGETNMTRRRHRRAATQHHLIGHEFAVVLADGSFRRPIAGIGHIGTGGPFPNI